MELGKGTLRGNGMNCLQNVLHPDHGLLWTDGKGIFQAPVHVYRDQVESAGSTCLGEFDNVQSVHWSCCLKDDCCYMAAVHEHIVTVWRVSGAVPSLAFKQVRKINVQPVPQGCLWNPKNDVLCLLSRQQCSFYFRHTHNRGSFAFPSLEHEKISCGCWSPDGKRLVVCVGAAFLIYTWSDPEANINDFVTAAWKIPGVSGTITAIVPASNSTVVCASDLPLQTLCTRHNTDTFVMPDIREKQVGSTDIIKPHEGMSVKDGLLNLERSQKPHVQDSAMLTVVHLRPGPQDPTLLTSVQVPGLLSPDLLHFQGDSQCIVVGSNTQSTLQVFALLDNRLLSAGHVTLGKEERPKGVCTLHTTQLNNADGVLVLVGTLTQNSSVFPSSNHLTSYVLALKFFPIRPEKTRQLPNGHAVPTRTASTASLTKSESVRENRSQQARDSYPHTRQASFKGERPDHRFRSPDRGMPSETRIKLSLMDISSGEAHPRLVEEITDSPWSLVEEVDGRKENSALEDLETDRVDFSESIPHFHCSELSQAYEIDPRTSDGTLNFTASESLSGQPATNDTAVNSSAAKSLSSETKSNDRSSHSSASKSLSSPRTTNNKASNSSASKLLSCQPSTTDKGAASKSSSGQPSSSVTTPRKVQSPVVGSRTKKSERTVHTDGSSAGQISAAAQSSRVPPTETPSPQLSSTASDKSSRPGGDDEGSMCSSLVSAGSSYEALEKQIQAQNDQIAALQKRLDELSALVEDTACVFPSKYQKMTDPETVSIQCVVGGAHVTRKFLLDCGRLQLDSVKQAFGLLSVELILDGDPLVLGANIDGYIPMKFTAGSFLQVTGIPVVYSTHFPQKLRNKEAAKS